MSEPKNGCWPAFPCDMPGPSHGKAGPSRIRYSGITVRDYFAAHAPLGVLDKIATNNGVTRAEAAFTWADALLAERDK